MLLRHQLKKLGLDKLAENRRELLPGWSPTFFRRLGTFDAVIDVGVLDGTQELYQAYPDAHLVLIEALPTYKKQLKRILKKHPGGGELFMNAAVEKEGDIEFNHVHSDPRLSGRHKSLISKREATKIRVKGVPLDSIFEKSKALQKATDILLKIDTEGGEMGVLKGFSKNAPRVSTIITETSIMKRHEGSYRFAELIAWMSGHGFELFDILTVTRRKALYPGARIADCVFKNEALAG